MTPRVPKKRTTVLKPRTWDGVERRQPWGGACRRKRQARSVDWRGTGVGLFLLSSGIALHAILQTDLVPIALIVVGGAMIDKEAIKVGSRMFSLRKSNNTEEYPYGGRGV